MEKVVVELIMFGQRKSWSEVTLGEAKEILARPMNPGCRWHIPEWQFTNEQRPFEGSHTLDAQAEAYRLVRAS